MMPNELRHQTTANIMLSLSVWFMLAGHLPPNQFPLPLQHETVSDSVVIEVHQ